MQFRVPEDKRTYTYDEKKEKILTFAAMALILPET